MFPASVSKRVEMPPQLHIADLQTKANVQVAAAFWECFFYFHPNNCSISAAHQDPSYLLVQLPPSIHYAGSLLLTTGTQNRHTSLCTHPVIFLPYTTNKRTTTMSQWRKWHGPITCNERALGSLQNWSCKVIHLILWAKLQLLQSQNEKPHPQVSCLTVDGCHLTFPAAGCWFKHQSK